MLNLGLKRHPKPDEALRGFLELEIAEIRKPQPDGVSFIDFYYREATSKPGKSKELIEAEIEEQIHSRIVYRMMHLVGGKKEQHEVEVHFYLPPEKFISVRYRFIDGDYFHVPIKTSVHLDFAPEPHPLITAPVEPPPKPQKPQPTQGGKPVLKQQVKR